MSNTPKKSKTTKKAKRVGALGAKHVAEVVIIAWSAATKILASSRRYEGIEEIASKDFWQLVDLMERSESAHVADPDDREQDARQRAAFFIGMALGSHMDYGDSR